MCAYMHATRTRVYVCVYVDGQVFMHTPHSDLVFSEMKLVTPQQKKHAAQRCQQSVSTMPAAAVYIIIIFLYYIYFTGLWERPGTGTGKLMLCTHPHNTQQLASKDQCWHVERAASHLSPPSPSLPPYYYYIISISLACGKGRIQVQAN